uniref:Discs large log 5a n=1 Tax=Rhipicephalus zambeziensis TaxID=60191 RepID=A0A224YRI2_9ACAR
MYLGGAGKNSGAPDEPPGMSQSVNLGHGKADCLLSSDRDLPRRDLRQVHADHDSVYRRLTMAGDRFNPSMGKTHASSSDWSLSSCRDYDYNNLVPTDPPVKLEQDFYHGKHKSKAEDHWQEILMMKKENGDLLAEKRLLEQEVKRLQRIVDEKQKELSELHHQKQEGLMETGGEAAYRQKCKALKEEYDTLHKRYADLTAAHSAHMARLELCQEELQRLKQGAEEALAERNAALRDRTGLQQQCTAAIRQWDSALRERNEARDQLAKVQQQRDEAMKEINQAMAVRIKASKDLSRLTEERNAAVQEYTLIMSERDSVHKEIERLQEELQEAQSKARQTETAHKASLDEMEGLKREIASALQDRDRALKELSDLREKQAECNQQSSSEDASRAEAVRKDSLPSSLADAEQTNQEMENLRRNMERLQVELAEAQQEAEVCKRRRDWAFSERDKIVLERESIRSLCDKLRRERDRAVSDLAEALRDSDDIKRQRNEASKELKELKEKIEAQLEKESRMKQLNSVGNNHSRDSAIDTDLQEWETEIKEVHLRYEGDFGFDISGGKEEMQAEPSVAYFYVSSILKGGTAEGKLLVNDVILKVNGLDVAGMDKRTLCDTVQNSKGSLTLVVKRRRAMSSRGVIMLSLNLSSSHEHGITLENGLYITRIGPGSVAAREGTLAVGDRILSINGKPVEDLRKAMECLDNADSAVQLQVVKNAVFSSSPSSSTASGHNFSEKLERSPLAHGSPPAHPREEKSFVSCSVQTDTLHELGNHSKTLTLSSRSSKSGGASERATVGVQPTLLDKAYNKIFGEKRVSKEKKALLPDEKGPIEELDSMLECYSKTGGKRSSGRQQQEHNGGTWPKYRGPPLQLGEAGVANTLQPHKRRERKSLASFTKQLQVPSYADFPAELSSPSSGNCTSSSGSYASPGSPPKAPTGVQQSSERVPLHYAAGLPEDRLDYSVVSAHKDVLEMYQHRGGLKSRPHSAHYPREAYAKPVTPYADVLLSSHVHQSLRANVPLYPQPRGHQHAYYPTYISRSGDSLLAADGAESLRYGPLGGAKGDGRYTPSPCPSQYSFSGTSPTHSLDFPQQFQPVAPAPKRLVPTHVHGPFRPEETYPQPSYDGLATFPKRNQRIRIPSTPSVTSKSSAGKVSTSSIEKAPSLTDRSSPMPAFTVELLTPNGSRAITELRGRRRPKPGDMRRIVIEKSLEPLGIQIKCGAGGTIFVSSVSENSIAAQASLQVGDQLLEVCGINMRNATYQLAANVLRQCRDSITMLVQFNPDKYREVASDNISTSEENSPVDTPAASPKMRHSKRSDLIRISNDDVPSSATSTLTRQKQSCVSAKGSRAEPRIVLLRKASPSLGITLLGGNAVGIFVHSVQEDSPASGPGGLLPGDQILEYNGTDLRNATAEEAAYELASNTENVHIVAQYNPERFAEIQEQPGDSFYVKALFDRASIDGSLAFHKDDILYVDNTMYKGVPGQWRAWILDQDGQKLKCGFIPSKYKAEEELLMKRSLLDLEEGGTGRRGSTSTRRSFFRRRRHQQRSREDGKELASFSDVSINNSCGGSAGTLAEDVPPTYLRVDRLNYPSLRPVILVGPLQEAVVDKLEQDFPEQFQRCPSQPLRGSLQALEKGLQDLSLLDFRRRGSHFECLTRDALRYCTNHKLCHALLDVSLSAVERLNRCQIFPIVIFIKFKTTKQIREVKDSTYLTEKVTTKAAKEMYEHALKIESEYKHLINAVIPGSNLAYMCTQVKMCVDDEQNKALWVPSGSI